MVEHGETLARQGRYSEAIDAFKAADRAHPDASHACLIALAYTRRELWPQAEIFLDRCRAARDVPDWVPTAEEQLRERLGTVNVAAVEIVVEPDVHADLTVSSFAPDESFAPRTIHLPIGQHVVTARAPGYDQLQQTISVADKTPQRVVLHLHKTGEKPSMRHVPGKLPWYVLGAGGVVTAGAIVFHATVYRSAYNELQATQADVPSYPVAKARFDMLEPSFRTKQAIAWSLYGVGIATAITGVVMHYAHVGDTEVLVEPRSGGGVVSLGWRR
jgi:hypothetical protein